MPFPKNIPYGLVLSSLLWRHSDDFSLLAIHAFFLRRLALAGGGASKAVTTYT
jgi:hypothetical protein